MSAPVPAQVLEEAAEWLMRMSESELAPDEHAEWEQWRRSSPARSDAWARAQVLQAKLGGLPSSVAMSALERPDSPQRRVALGKLAALLALLPAGWASWKLAEVQGWSADYHTGVGQQRELTLADGSQLTLNTATAIDVRFDAGQRLVRLRQGEILVQTAPDTSPLARPFVVSTDQGRMQALGTRFSVREWPARTQLAVLEGAVRVDLARQPSASARVITAGQRSDFTDHDFGPLQAVDASVSAWAQGMLMADNLPLAELVAELGRYRHGFVRCDPAIAQVRVSGAFPISDSQRTLAMLVQTYPVVVSGHLNGYWITLSAA
ncbi:FecR domain-containing protein [Pseudomonas aegrilactucae]|uniref:FecR domain-containing protein n=1 Tax=Pseudomonas aegrilactucae TaxID=2854028 RepID=A0A9Q2XM54_9PSED|nr:FecR domain-containing protein [Pseudomonas aegrilactucae]MBV6289552.1 FecR domain-containing protein [Pseudomonas aegrilactucae]